MTRRTKTIVLAVCAALVGLPGAAHAALPDLVADPPENPYLEPYADAGAEGGARLLLRFDGHVHNVGAGALEIRRDVLARGTSVVQRIFREGLDPFDRDLGLPRVVYETNDGHDHFHLQRIARYSLADGTGDAEVAPAMKVGFCLLDSTRITGDADRTYNANCMRGQPAARSVVMGVSSGWRDLYAANLPFQWVDVTHTTPGAYRLRSQIDPEGFVEEADETNDLGEQPVEVPGFVANAVDATLPASGPWTIPLTSESYGPPLNGRRFTVVDGPDRGTLDQATTDGTSLTYTPAAPGAPQADRFTIVATDPASAYPRSPARATVVLRPNGEPVVALSRVPARIYARTMADLDADVVGVAGQGPVTWSVEGIDGGDATVGRIDAAGRYVAPPTPPADPVVTIRAQVGETVFDEMDVTVLAAPAEVPSPTPPAPPGDRPGVPADPPPTDDPPADDPVVTATPPVDPPRAMTTTTTMVVPPAVTTPSRRPRTPVGTIRAARVGKVVAVSVVPTATGTLRVALMSGRKRLRSCVLRVRTGRSVVCRLRGASSSRTLLLTLRRPGGQVEQRRLTVRAALRARS